MSESDLRIRLAKGTAAAIAAVGNGAALARKVGVTKYAVQQWKASGIPLRRVGKVASVTGIPVHELRPDLFDDGAAVDDQTVEAAE